MGFIPTITCRKCRKQYSGLKKRCPYCQTPKGSGAYKADAAPAEAQERAERPQRTDRPRALAMNENTRWQFIFGIVLLAAVIITVIVLISLSIRGDFAEPSPTENTDIVTTPPPTPIPTPTPSPTPEVSSITITYAGSKREEFTMSVGEQVDLEAMIFPLDGDVKVTWSSADEDICVIDENGVVTGIGPGVGKIFAECGAVKEECIVRVREG